METSTNDFTISDPSSNVSENNDGNLNENDFHFGYLTVESSTDSPCNDRYLRYWEERNVPGNILEEPLINIGDSNVQSNDFEEASNFGLYEKIPSLQAIASDKVATLLWRRIISFEDSERHAVWHPTFELVSEADEYEVCMLIPNLPVPRLIRELVEDSVSLVRSEFNEWVNFYKNVFKVKRCPPENPIKMSDLMFCHWLPNGTIDHRKTALNMLSNPRLIVTDKFKIMCAYCLEDEIKQLSPKSIPESFVEKIIFEENPLIYYWLCHMNGNLDKLPRKNGQSVECFLITASTVDTWSAIEYFWNRLSFNEQVSTSLVLVNQKPRFQRQLFSKMNEFQKCHVLSTIPFQITMNFWKQKSQERFAYLTWIRIKDTITYDQFTKFIQALLTESLPDHVDKLRYLVKIWNSSSDNFINRALNSMRNTVIELHTRFYDRDRPRDLEFLLTFLSYGSVEYRKTTMFEQGSNLVLCYSFSMFDRLIKLCLPGAKDVIQFKNILLKSEDVRHRCCSMLAGDDGGLEQLINFLDHYSPNPNAKTEFLNGILETWTTNYFLSIYSLQRCYESIDFIDKHILDTLPDQAIKLQKRIVWSFVEHCAQCWRNDDEMNKFFGVVDRIFDADDINEFKTSLVQTLQTRYRWSEFNEEYIHSLLSWCFNNDDQKIKEFKESLSIDDMFVVCWERMKCCVGWGSRHTDSKTLHQCFLLCDKMLLWCFESMDEVKKYKLKKVFGYGEGVIKMPVTFRNGFSEEYTRIALPWFFDGDEEQIRKFKEMYKDDLISSLIDVE